MDDFRFDRATHTYWRSERRLPSVTEIIAPLVDYSMVPEDRLEFARDRGTAVHLACHLDDMSNLREESVDPQVRPYLEGWRKFKRDFGVEIALSEEPRYSELGYAGTPDKLLIAHAGTRDAMHVVADIKTVAQMTPVIGVQLSAYEMLLRNEAGVSARWGVQLRKDGTYQRHTYPYELPTFLSLLTLHNWRMKHGA